MGSSTAPATEPSALAPLRITLFRWLWIAGIVSNIGNWMQTVGAQWFLIEQRGLADGDRARLQPRRQRPSCCSASRQACSASS